MMLLIDIGNSRIKWASLNEHGLTPQQATVYSEWDVPQFKQQVLNENSPTRILIANVGGESIAAVARNAIKEACHIDPEFIRSTAAAAGIRSGYRFPEKLGVDRWLALIAAHRLQKRACCVVSVGTAMTVDGVDASGQHLGGIIVPGPDLMINSLLRNTSDIAARARDGNEGSGIFADNTQGAIYQGASHALAAVVEHACAEMRHRFAETPVLFVTGGASDRVTPILRVPFLLVPDLVLRGLAEIARDSTA